MMQGTPLTGSPYHKLSAEGSDINEKKIVFHEPDDGRM